MNEISGRMLEPHEKVAVSKPKIKCIIFHDDGLASLEADINNWLEEQQKKDGFSLVDIKQSQSSEGGGDKEGAYFRSWLTITIFYSDFQ